MTLLRDEYCQHVGQLLSIYIETLVEGGVRILAEYGGPPDGEHIFGEHGRYATLAEAAAVVPSIPLAVDVEYEPDPDPGFDSEGAPW